MIGYEMPLIEANSAVVDDEGKFHSSDDEPSSLTVPLNTIPGNFGCYAWYSHGQVHRGGDKPAIIQPNFVRWSIHGWYHRENGPAVYFAVSQNRIRENYYLFNREVTPEFIVKLQQISQDRQLPLWVVWLLEFEIIGNNELEICLNNEGVWEPNMPIEWMFKVWGLTNNSLASADLEPIIYLKSHSQSWLNEPPHRFMKVASFLDSENKKLELVN